MNRFPSRSEVMQLRKSYPRNTRIVLDLMDDSQAPPIGAQATVKGVDDAGSIMPIWDTGSSLHIVYGADKCHKVTTEEEAETSLNHFGEIWRWGNRCPRCGKEGRLLALSRRAKIRICEQCGMEEALESVKANRDIGKLYEDMSGVKRRLDWAIMELDWEKCH